MTPILVEPLSEQAYELLRQLEALHVLRVVPAEAPTQSSIASLIGSISPQAGEQMLRETAKMRNEWERES